MRHRVGIIIGLSFALGAGGLLTSAALADTEQCVVGDPSKPDVCKQYRYHEYYYGGQRVGFGDDTTYGVGTSAGDHRDIAYVQESCGYNPYGYSSPTYTVAAAGQEQTFWPAIPLPGMYGTNYITPICDPANP